jgi:hypothetical protein
MIRAINQNITQVVSGRLKYRLRLQEWGNLRRLQLPQADECTRFFGLSAKIDGHGATPEQVMIVPLSVIVGELRAIWRGGEIGRRNQR